MKNYDNLVLMHYGVKGMKWRYHKRNGSNSLYDKRRAQMHYSRMASNSNRQNSDAEPTHWEQNGEDSRRKSLDTRNATIAKNHARIARIKSRDIGSPSKVDDFGNESKRIKKKRAEYDNGGPNSNPEDTRRRLVDQKVKDTKKRAVSDSAAARIKAAGDRALNSVKVKEKKDIGPIGDMKRRQESGFNALSRNNKQKLKKKNIEYDGNVSKYDPTKGKSRADKYKADRARVHDFLENARKRYNHNNINGGGSGDNGAWTSRDSDKAAISRYAGPKTKKKKKSS